MPDKFFNPAGCLNNYLPEDPACHEAWQQAASLLVLNLPDQALQQLAPGPAGMHPDAKLEAMRLLTMEQLDVPSAHIANAALAAVSAYGHQRTLVDMASLHLAISERYKELLHFFSDFKSGEAISGFSLHNIIIAAAHLGWHEKALETMVEARSVHLSPSELLLDPQLVVFWRHYAQSCPSLHEAKLLTSAEVRNIVHLVLEGSPPTSVCEYGMNKSVPKAIVPHLERKLTAQYELNAGAPETVRLGFRRWLGEFRHRQLRLARRALHHANDRMKVLRPKAVIPSSRVL